MEIMFKILNQDMEFTNGEMEKFIKVISFKIKDMDLDNFIKIRF
jgi:hypothetical protein